MSKATQAIEPSAGDIASALHYLDEARKDYERDQPYGGSWQAEQAATRLRGAFADLARLMRDAVGKKDSL